MYFRKLIMPLVLMSIGHVTAQEEPHHWETSVFSEDTWNYFEGLSQPPLNWNDTSFDASVWKSGKGGFGYGDGDDGTITDTVITVYSRIDFNITDLSKLASGVLNFDYDDAIIIYLNGREIVRKGIDDEDARFDTPSTTKHEAQMHKGTYPLTFELTKDSIISYLHEGKNTLAAEVHNESLNSSDLSSIIYLSFGISDESVVYRDTPEWFRIPEAYSSHLPLVIINTNSQGISRDMITATMKIVDNGYDSINKITDYANGYNGYIGIRYRGHASAGFPQKPYRIETRDAFGENNNAPLLGMPEENDWALIANYKDRTFVKHSLGFHLSRKMGFYAPRMKHCEVILNGQPQGIYMLSELIKQDKNRVDIASLKNVDTAGDQLTGGYIFKVDYYESDGSDSWIPFYQPPHNSIPVHFVYEDPEPQELLSIQKAYIQNFVEKFEKVLYSSEFKDTKTGYRAFLNVPSFINYLLIQEVSQNNDGYKKSCHYHKDKDRNNIRALLNAGPVWDLDWGWRAQPNSNDPARAFLTGLEYNRTLEVIWPTPVTWMPRLMEDPQFANEVYTTFSQYRENVLNSNSMLKFIDSVSNYLGEAKDTHYKLWHGTGDNSTAFYDNERNILKNWLSDRMIWLDTNLPGEVIDTSEFISSPITHIDSSLIIYDTNVVDTITHVNGILFALSNKNFMLYPSSVSSQFKVISGTGINRIGIYNVAGSAIRFIETNGENSRLVDVNNLLPGVYIVRTELDNGHVLVRKFMKK